MEGCILPIIHDQVERVASPTISAFRVRRYADTPTPVLCPCQRYRVNNGLAIELLAKFAEEFIEHLLTRCLHKP
jgi:hypothetical protein